MEKLKYGKVKYTKVLKVQERRENSKPTFQDNHYLINWHGSSQCFSMRCWVHVIHVTCGIFLLIGRAVGGANGKSGQAPRCRGSRGKCREVPFLAASGAGWSCALRDCTRWCLEHPNSGMLASSDPEELTWLVIISGGWEGKPPHSFLPFWPYCSTFSGHNCLNFRFPSSFEPTRNAFLQIRVRKVERSGQEQSKSSSNCEKLPR